MLPILSALFNLSSAVKPAYLLLARFLDSANSLTVFKAPLKILPTTLPAPLTNLNGHLTIFLAPLKSLLKNLSTIVPWSLFANLSNAHIDASLRVPASIVPTLVNALPIGSKNLRLNHLPRLSLISFIKSLNGSVTCHLRASASPPLLIPSLPGVPNIAFLNPSVVEINPNPDPNTALDNIPIPNGSNSIIPREAADILGNALLIAACLSLFNKPVSSPKRNFFAASLFFKIPIPAPIIAPPNGPNGVNKPATVPPIPNPFISGKYLLTASTHDCGNNPSSKCPCPVSGLSTIHLPNTNSLNVLL